MSSFWTPEHLSFIFGIIASVVSFVVFLSPVPTFCTIYRKKTSEGFQSIPYVVALMSTMLLVYYGLLRSAYVIIGINSIGLVMEATYIIFYLIYAPRKEKMFTLRLVTFFNIGGYSLVALATNFLAKDHHNRVRLLGTICAAFNLAEFAAPLAIMRRVIKTKSVEYMPFTLSFTLTLCAALWFLYGFLRKDFFIAVPSMVGFAFGIAQLILYLIYKDSKKNMEIPKQQGGGSTGTSVDLKGIQSKNDNSNQHIEMSSEPEHMKSNENNV